MTTEGHFNGENDDQLAQSISERSKDWLMIYPLVMTNITMDLHPTFLMGKSTISTGPCKAPRPRIPGPLRSSLVFDLHALDLRGPLSGNGCVSGWWLTYPSEKYYLGL